MFKVIALASIFLTDAKLPSHKSMLIQVARLTRDLIRVTHFDKGPTLLSFLLMLIVADDAIYEPYHRPTSPTQTRATYEKNVKN